MYLHLIPNLITHTDGKLRQKRPGSLFGLKLYMYAAEEDYLANPSGASGFKMLLSTPGEVMEVRDMAFELTPAAHTMISITAYNVSENYSTTKIKRNNFTQYVELSEPYGKCNDNLQLRYYETYSEAKCRRECMTNFTVDQCGCSLVYLPGGSTYSIA